MDDTQQFLIAFGEKVHALLSRGEASAAEAEIVPMLKRFKNHPALMLLLVRALSMQSKYESLLKVCKALEASGVPCHEWSFWNDYGTALCRHGAWKDAIAKHYIAMGYLEAMPPSAESAWCMTDVCYAIGFAYDVAGAFEDAGARYADALGYSQGRHESARFALTLLSLKCNHLSAMLQDYEQMLPARYRAVLQPLQVLNLARWRGEALADKKLLLVADQGLGDRIMFAGLLRHVAQQAAHVSLWVQPELLSLFARSFASHNVEVRLPPPASELMHLDVDYYAPLSSLLPCVARYRPAQHGPYVKPDAGRVAELRALYQQDNRPLVGISWRSIHPESGFVRSIALEQWAAILRMPDVRFVSLQYDECNNELMDVAERLGVQLWLDDRFDPTSDYEFCAAQVAAMDAVVTIQNSAAHVAGAMGIPTCLLMPKSGDYRWGVLKPENAWYASVVMVRQQQFGNWSSELQQAAQWLRAQLGLNVAAQAVGE